MLLLLPFIPLVLFFGLIVGGVFTALAVTGGPGQCKPGGATPIVQDQANATSFQLKWDAFNATLDRGSPASVSFTESEVSSRAWREVIGDSEKDDDVFEGPRVCLHDGYGEASAHLALPGFLDIKMKARGTAELTDQLVLHVDEFQIGNLPGLVAERIETNISLLAPGEVDPSHSYQVTVRQGAVQVDGVP